MLKKLNLKYENHLKKQGYLLVAGLDEAGRGSWAGPLVAGAVILHPDKKIKKINDSKLLNQARREQLFLEITKNCLLWSVGLVSHQEIDELGIIPANRLVFERAIKKLPVTPDYLLVDGLRNFDSRIKNEFVVGGDAKIASIAAASIIAKVVRDQILKQLHQQYPEYHFSNHKGYGTPEHQELLQKYGPSEVHRRSYKPIANLL